VSASPDDTGRYVAPLSAHWSLDASVAFLNHGSFGACPTHVLDFQSDIRKELERDPVDFLVRELEPRLDDARTALADFVGADADDLVFVPNATAGANTVLRSLQFEAGDEILITDHVYNAVGNAATFVADRWGARIVIAAVPFPLSEPQEFTEAVLAGVGPRTRLVMLDHVTSPTAIVCPIAATIAALSQRGIDTLIDGAHAPGMVPVGLKAIGATYYTGNCHKWLCAPKGAAFLYVQRDKQALIRPLVISHGANSPRTDRSRFQLEFAWTGTGDPSAALSVPESLRYLETLVAGGWPALMRRNTQLALAARELICACLDVAPSCPDSMIGSMASVPLPPATAAPSKKRLMDPLHEALFRDFAIEVPVHPWPRAPQRLLRVSAQLYNDLSQYQRLCEALTTLL